jgi:DNA-nicking Smr family endonuclease
VFVVEIFLLCFCMVKKVRVRKVNKYEQESSPQDTFDFHGRGILTELEIQSLARNFVLESDKKGYSRVLIITGKGMHSKNGPVIGPLLRHYLLTLAVVRRVVIARRDRGGEGALEVQLR